MKKGTTAHHRRAIASPLERRRSVTGFLLVLPCVLFVAAFFLVPLAMTGWISLHNWPLLGDIDLAGLGNYRLAVDDTTFRSSLGFTTKYTIVSGVITFALGFGLALLVRGDLPATPVLRTAYFLPISIGWAVASFLWVWLLNSQVGAATELLQASGVVGSDFEWFTSSDRAFAALVGLTVWKSAGFAMIVFLIGMQSIPRDLYEAARVDGASWWHEIRYVMLPLIRSTLVLVSLFLVTAFYLGFDQFFILTRGGPNNETASVVFWIYNNAFVRFNLGYGAALSLIFLALLIVVNGVQVRVLRRDVTE
jgi:multiple sugar transport system permease protein